MPTTDAPDLFAPLREIASAAARNLGLATDPQKLAPEHWQRVLTSVETRARMRGIELPEDWREELAEQMGRVGANTGTGSET